jgi:hypothetical protein
MTEACDYHGTAMKHGSATLLARIVGHDAEPITRAAVSAAAYSVFLLDDFDPDARTPVAGHDEVELAAADVVFDTLQNDARWTVDALGYNFRHTLDVSQSPAFAVAGRRYLVEYRLTPAVGQVILVRFRINVI